LLLIKKNKKYKVEKNVVLTALCNFFFLDEDREGEERFFLQSISPSPLSICSNPDTTHTLL
jgi:hypothetical protein